MATFKLNNPPADLVSALQFSPTDPKLLAVSSWDKSVVLHNTVTNNPILSYTHNAAVLDIAFSKDGTKIYRYIALISFQWES